MKIPEIIEFRAIAMTLERMLNDLERKFCKYQIEQ